MARPSKLFCMTVYNVGPTAKTLGGRCRNVIQTFCVCWVCGNLEYSDIVCDLFMETYLIHPFVIIRLFSNLKYTYFIALTTPLSGTHTFRGSFVLCCREGVVGHADEVF